MTYKNRSYHNRDLYHGSPAFRADVLTIAPPRLPTLYANFSIYKLLTSFVLLSDLLFPAVGGPIILFSALLTYGRRPVYSSAFYSSGLLFPAIGDPIIFGSFTNLCTVAIFILFVSVFRSTDALLYQS